MEEYRKIYRNWFIGKIDNSKETLNKEFNVEEGKPIIRSKDVSYYLHRITYFFHKAFKCDDSCFIVGIIYLNKLIDNNKIVINRSTWYKYAIISLIVAMSYLQDLKKISLEQASRLLHFNKEHYLDLVLVYLELLDWELYVEPGKYKVHYEKLISSLHNNRLT